MLCEIYQLFGLRGLLWSTHVRFHPMFIGVLCIQLLVYRLGRSGERGAGVGPQGEAGQGVASTSFVM
jgi:hypothetical protein